MKASHAAGLMKYPEKKEKPQGRTREQYYVDLREKARIRAEEKAKKGCEVKAARVVDKKVYKELPPQLDVNYNPDNELNRKMMEWKIDPALFVREVIGADPTTQQQEGLKELALIVRAKLKAFHGREMAPDMKERSEKLGINIMSGRGTGKDAFAAWAIMWFLPLFERAKIPCTAPTGHQLNDILWAEIGKWINHSKERHHEEARRFGATEAEIATGRYDGFVATHLVWQSEKVFVKERGGQEWFAIPRTCNVKGTEKEQSETLSGFHEDFLMAVIDEASGVPDAAFRPLETTLTGKCNFILAIYNPTRSTGFAIEGQYGDSNRWITLRWNAEESEITNKALHRDLETKYGRDSNPFRIHVLGLPPRADADTLIPWDWIQDAVDREITPLPEDAVLLGVDVGAGGDKSVITVYQGGKMHELERHNTKDTMELVGWVVQKFDAWEAKAVMIDVIGVGKGVYDRLKEAEVKAHAVDVRRSPRNDERFHKLRDELWWRLRERFEKGTISIIKDQDLIDQLGAIKYKPDSTGKIKVESKDEYKKRGMGSPDEADSLMLIMHLAESIFRSRPQADDYDDDEKYRRRLERMQRWEPERNWMAA